MLKLLVVDDEPIIRRGICGIIEWEKYGYTICGEAEDGPSAVAAIQELKPDLVLLDLHLPGFSGLEVVKKTGKEKSGGATRFLILSGYAEFNYAKEAINLGVGGYLTKPVEESALIERILGIAQEIKNKQLSGKEEESDKTFFREKKYFAADDPDFIVNTGADWNIDKQIQTLCALIQAADQKKVHDFFLNLAAGFCRSGKDPRKIRQECMILMIEVRSRLVDKIPALKEKLDSDRKILDIVMEQRYLDDIMETMTIDCLNICRCLPLPSANASFQRVLSYVQNNYNEDLKLETLGKLFNYNCAYLGQRFKEYTGQKFHNYLDKLRIDAAKELLRNTDMKIYEISVKVGYTNTDYFYSKFKKHEGEKPMFYRKKVIAAPLLAEK